MRRSPLSVLFFCALALILALTACGGGTPKANVATLLAVSPAVVSMNRGDVATINVQATDSKNAAVSVDFTYSSNNPALVSVSNAGSLCAGKWDTNYVVCTPASTTGTATVTVTVKNNTTLSASLTVYVHAKVDRVVLNPLASGCLSSGKSQQLTATAYSTDPATCSILGAGSAPCVIPNSSLGQYTFLATDADVVSIDNGYTAPGTATGNAPGLTSVIASVSNVNSSAAPFLVCPMVSLSFRNGDTHDTAPFTLAKAATKTMEVTAVDTAGVTLTAPPIAYFTDNPYGLTIAAGSIAAPGSAATATVTAINSASQALLFSGCLPPTCNKNLTGIYSAGIFGSVSGTLTAPTIYAASTSSLSLIPVDSSNSTPGTAITLPYLPNSFFINRQGTKGILGADSNPLMLFDPVGKTVATITGVVGGKVLALSPDGTFAFVTTSTTSYLVNLGTSTATIASLYGGAIGAEFSPDSRFLYYTRGTPTLYSVDMTTTNTFVYNEVSNINDLTVIANGPAVYLAQAGAINVIAACNLQTFGFWDTQTATAPNMLMSIPNGSGITAIDGSNLLLINTASISQACPPAISETTTPIALNFTSGTPRQSLVTLDGTKAVVTSSANQVAIVTLASATSKPVTLSGSASVAGTGDISADSSFLWVGGSDNAIHKIDLNAATDGTPIAVALKDASSTAVAPNLIAVKAN